MGGKNIEKLPHSCGSRDGLQVFEAEDGTYNGYCFACDTVVDDPYHDKPRGYKPKVGKKKTQEEIEQEIKEIEECVPRTVDSRKLHELALKQFGIRIGVSPVDGKTPTIAYFPIEKDGKVVKYKAKSIKTKKMWHVGSADDPDLFGWSQAIKTGSKRLFIVEGEWDAPALFTIIKKHQKAEYKDSDPAVVSVVNGAGSAAKEISRALPKIRKNFSEVVLVFDTDKAGQEGVEKVLRIAPDFIQAELPCKDANDCLLEGFTKAAFNAVMFRAEKAKNTRLVWGESVHEEAKIPAEFGLSWPWQGITDLTRGIRTGETIYIGAAQKMGLLT